MQRVITGAVLAALMAVLVFRASPDLFKLAVGAVAVIAAFELARIAQRLARNPALWLLPVLVALVAYWQWGTLATHAEAGLELLVLLGVFVGLATLLSSRGGRASRDPLQAPAAAGLLAFGTAYLGGAAVAMGRLHEVDRWLFFLLVVIVTASDTAAYYGGRATGKHKLAPAVSPNKTIEGSAWGLAFAVLCVCLYSMLRLDRIEPRLLALGGVTAIAGQLGDLVESLFKRAAGVKDSGRILPGHGGVLDRIDALLFAAPVLYLGSRLLGVERFLP